MESVKTMGLKDRKMETQLTQKTANRELRLSQSSPSYFPATTWNDGVDQARDHALKLNNKLNNS
jgi:hypothetical protein